MDHSNNNLSMDAKMDKVGDSGRAGSEREWLCIRAPAARTAPVNRAAVAAAAMPLCLRPLVSDFRLLRLCSACGPNHPAQVLLNQAALSEVLRNQQSILKNQSSIEGNQAALKQILHNQTTMQTEQHKMSEMIAADREIILGLQKSMQSVIDNQKAILAKIK